MISCVHRREAVMDTAPVGIYARLSDARDEEQTATARQIADCRELAAAKGWTVAEVYEDSGLSGWKRGTVRPEYERLLADLEAGRIGGVVAWKLDRLGRNRRDYTRLLDLVEERDVTLTLVRDPVDTSTPMGRSMLDIIASFARMESENISTRTSRALEEKAQNGRAHVSGQRPFGLNREWAAIVPTEAERIRDAATRILAGESLGGIAREWNAAGLRTTAGKEWRTFTISRMLQSPHLAALRVHRGEVIGPGAWPAILDETTHERLKSALKPGQRNHGNAGGGRARYLLSGGILRCGLCGAKMVSRPRDDKVRRYVCRKQPGVEGCGGVGILAEPLEELVTEAVLSVLEGPGLADALAAATGEDEAQAELVDQLRADEDALKQLSADHYVHRVIGRAEFLGAHEALESRIAETRAQLARHEGSTVLGGLHGDVREEWARRSVEGRRAILSAVLEYLEVQPAVRGRAFFDPDRLPAAGWHWRI